MVEEKKNRSVNIVIAALVFFAAVIIFIIILLNSGNETYFSNDGEEKIVTALSCSAGSLEGEFFASSNANMIKNQIKVTFSNDRPDKLFYSFEGVYRSYDVAEQDNANLHAKYNKYLGGNGIDHESLTPTFSTVNSKLQINLYAKNLSLINRITAVLFFINSDDFETYLSSTRDQIADYYQKQGFSCEKQN